MKGFLYFICFLLLLPVLAVAGHDGYLAYQQTQTIEVEKFKFSDLGWLWVTYAPMAYDTAKDSFTEDNWRGMVEPILRMTALTATGTVAGIWIGFVVILKVLGLPPFSEGGILGRVRTVQSKNSRPSLLNDDKRKTTYKRK